MTEWPLISSSWPLIIIIKCDIHEIYFRFICFDIMCLPVWSVAPSSGLIQEKKNQTKQ